MTLIAVILVPCTKVAATPKVAATSIDLTFIGVSARATATQVAIHLSRETTYTVRTLAPTAEQPYRIYIDFDDTKLTPGATRLRPLTTGPVMRVRAGQFTPTQARVVLDLKKGAPYTLKTRHKPFSVLLHVKQDVAPNAEDAPPEAVEKPTREKTTPPPTSTPPAGAETNPPTSITPVPEPDPNAGSEAGEPTSTAPPPGDETETTPHATAPTDAAPPLQATAQATPAPAAENAAALQIAALADAAPLTAATTGTAAQTEPQTDAAPPVEATTEPAPKVATPVDSAAGSQTEADAAPLTAATTGTAARTDPPADAALPVEATTEPAPTVATPVDSAAGSQTEGDAAPRAAAPTTTTQPPAAKAGAIHGGSVATCASPPLGAKPDPPRAAAVASRAQTDPEPLGAPRAFVDRADAGGGKPGHTSAVHLAPTFASSLRVVIDPGHGGTDPGAPSLDGAWEKDIVLEFAHLLAGRARERLGVSVVLTREADQTLSIAERAALAADGNSLFISIHANAAPKRWIRGVQTFYAPDGACGPASRRLARLVHQRVLRAVDGSYGRVRDGGVKPRRLGVLRQSRAPSLLLETAYVSNPVDRLRLADPHYRNVIVDGIVDGIADYLSGIPEPLPVMAGR